MKKIGAIKNRCKEISGISMNYFGVEGESERGVRCTTEIRFLSKPTLSRAEKKNY